MINIQDPKDCCGCGACIAVCPKHCISMQENEEGFLYPVVDKAVCIGCGLCNKTYPWEHKPNLSDRLSEPEVYAAWNLDEEVRRQSSSGGVFSVLAENILAQGGIVVGAAYVDGCKKVEHVIIESRNPETREWPDLSSLRGSKYVQSDVKSDIYRRIEAALKESRKVLFSGTPCQVAGLRNFLKSDYSNLYMCDIVCMGVPSPGFHKKMVKHIQEKENSKIESISFRDKSRGWKRPSIVYKLSSGNSIVNSTSSDLIYLPFARCLSIRYSCFSCKFKGIERIGDITLADFWGVSKKYQQYDLDDRGTSLIIVSTAKCKKWIKECGRKLFIGKADLETAVAGNPRIVSSAPKPLERNNFLVDSQTLSIELLKQKFRLYSPSLVYRIIRKIAKLIRAGTR